MPLFNFVRWLKSLSRRRGTTHYSKPRSRLNIESLEERIVPAPYTWTGAGLDNKWTNGANWAGGFAPTGTAATLDDLTFGPGGLQATTRNDFTGGVFGKITFAASGYTVIGNTLTLGDPNVAGSGYVVVNSNVTGSTISLTGNLQMGGAGGSQQFFTINSGADLLVASKITGTTGSNITKDGDGTLTLSGNNSGFIGDFNVSVGRLLVTNSLALGDTTGRTVVASGAQLQLSNVTGGSINEELLISGVGVANTGAMVNLAGSNTWSGLVHMDSNTLFVTATGSTLTISGVINDTGTGYNLTKDGPGQMNLTAINTFRGQVLIEDGILEISGGSVFDSINNVWLSALGTTDGASGTGTFINQSIGKVGRLQINSLTGITVVNERLQINSAGSSGSLINLGGDNVWTGNVILSVPASFGNIATINVNDETTLLIGQYRDASDPVKALLPGTGIVSGAATTPLTKTGNGNLIFTSANTYSGTTSITDGAVIIRDSRGMGATSAGTTVSNGAALLLEVDNISDSITGNTTSLLVSEPLTISGTGGDGLGALHSLSGYNVYSGNITQNSAENGIGVDQDTRRAYDVTFQNALGNFDRPLMTADWRGLTGTGQIDVTVRERIKGSAVSPLTNEIQTVSFSGNITGGTFTLTFNSQTTGPITWSSNATTLRTNIQNALDALGSIGATNSLVATTGHPTADNTYFTNDYALTVTGTISGTNAMQFDKLSDGHLILPNANTYQGATSIQGGWVTIQNNLSLGTPVANTPPTLQPLTTVFSNASLHLKPLVIGNNLTISNRFQLAGTGIDHNFDLINHKGAIVSLGGRNTLTGSIQIAGAVGMGVQQAFITSGSAQDTANPSELTATGTVQELPPTTNISAGSPSGSGVQNIRVIDTKTLAGGLLTLTFYVHGAPDEVRIYLGNGTGATASNNTPLDPLVLLYDSAGIYTVPNSTSPFTYSGSSFPPNRNGMQIAINYDDTTAQLTATPVPDNGTGPLGTGWDTGGNPNYGGAGNLTFPSFATRYITVVINQGRTNASGTVWTYSGSFVPNQSTGSGIVKLGQRRLNLQGDGTFTGDVDVAEGNLRVQHDSALGTAPDGSTSNTIVRAGASLELASGLAKNNGGIAGGIQVWNEHLILNGSGNSYFGTAPLVVMNGNDLAGNPMAGDAMWRGPVTLNTYGTDFDVTFQAALGLANQTPMTADGTNLVGTGAGVSVTTKTDGTGSLNEIQTVHFTGAITGGTFTLTFNSQLTGPIAWSQNASELTRNIQLALDALAGVGIGNTQVANTNATIDIRKGTRLNVFGAIDDGGSSAANGSDLNVTSTAGGSPYPGVAGSPGTGLSEILLGGTNTFRGTTYVPTDMVLVLMNGQGLGGSGTSAVQTVNLGSTSAGTFALSFNGASTAQLAFNATAAAIQTALNNLITIGGSTVGGSVSVTRSGNLITVTFGGNLKGFEQSLLVADPQGGATAVVAQTADGGGGTVVANGASIELQGNITVSGEPVILNGQGVGSNPAIPFRWFQQGPAPILAGQTPNGSPNSFSTTGRITGVAVDPRDSNVIYVATASGGAWKTTNGGATWRPLFDAASATPIPMFTGAIAVSAVDPNVIYLGTGEANNAFDSYYGTGVYKSTDAGITWSLVTGPSGPNFNPLDGKAVSKIVTDPQTGGNANRIYVAVSDLAAGGANGANAGIWYYNGASWTNLTPSAGGVTDNADIVFDNTNADWSDLAVMIDPVNTSNRWIAAAQGTPSGGSANVNGVYSNAVFLSLNNGATWTVNNFPTTETVSSINYPFAGVIKLGMGRINPSAGSPAGTGSTTRVYATVTYPSGGSNGTLAQTLRTIQFTDITWDATNLVWDIADWGAVGSIPANYLNSFGQFASAVTVNPAAINDVYIGGTGTAQGQNVVLHSTDGGSNWTDISVDATPRGPHAGIHAITLTSTGILVGTDGGIYKRDTSGTTTVWKDLNSNLAVTQFNGISVDPTNPNSAIGGSRSNGVEQYLGNFLWNFLDNKAAAEYLSTGGRVWIDPNNTQLMYAIEASPTGVTLRRSTNGGTTWSTLAGLGGSTFPLVMDSVNTNRLLVANGTLQQITIGPGPTYTGTTLNLGGQSQVTAIGAAAYQGDWVDDPSFTAGQGDVDAGANTYVPNTIYTIINGNQVWVTKNLGANWIRRDNSTTPLPGGLSLSDIIVDPRNRDTVYVITNTTRGTDLGRVFMSTNAGRDWTDITGTGGSALPDVAAWKIVIDPRSNTLYVGNDYGVYSSVAGSGSWTRVGQGMPFVQVRDLVLNQSLNTLSAGTYGRSMYTFLLPSTQANAGVMTSTSGSAVWSGAIILGSNTIISAKGTQDANSTSAATLNILGTISDQTANGNFKLDKTGLGNVILSGANTYGGVTEVKQGVLVARNAQALGASTAGTIVNIDTSLNVESNITGEPLFLNGDGMLINGHYTGSLRNTANNNTYTGPIIAQSADDLRPVNPGTGVTIGVNIGTTLTITNSITDLNQALTVTKELTGTLIYAQGVTFNVTFQGALGNIAQPTMTADGTNLTGTRPTVSVATVIPGSSVVPLKNAVQTISFGGNVTGGTFTLTYNNQTTGPITWTDDSATLLADIQAALENDTSIDPGDIAVAINMYRGGTVVNQGVLQLTNGMALGSEPGAITTVIDGAAVQFKGTTEVQTITVTGINGTFNVAFTGFPGQVATGIAYNASASALETALNAMLATSPVGNGGGTVTVTKSGTTYTITFGGTLTGVDVPQLDATRVGGTPASLPTATEATTVHGSGSIVVPDTQVLNLSGTGISNSGALISSVGSHVWSGNVTLQRTPAFSPGSNPSTIVAISATGAGDTLTIGGVIDDDINDPAAYGLNKVGAGKVILQGNNLYTGTTTVTTGTLAIQHVHALGGTTAGTTVNNGAMLQLDIAAGGTVAGEGLTLNGSGISNSGALQNLTGANIWSGTVALATSSTISVVGGSLNVTGNISGSAANTLTKRGANTLIVSNAANTFAGTTSVVQGILQVDGKLAAISLAGGTLGGTGTVGAITSAVAGGTVNPGDSPGVLNVNGNVTWNSATTYSVELNGTGAGQFDQLNVTGTVSIANATLAGTIGYLPTPVTDSFVIIKATGNISGNFGNIFTQSGNNFVYVGGYKFQVVIDNSGATKTVTLIHVASNTSTAVTTSKQSAVYGEGVTWTATVSNEQGGPASGTVDFIVDGTTTVAAGVVLTSGIGTFNTGTLGSPLNVGNHSVTVNFTSGSGSFANSTGSLVAPGQTVTKANSAVVVTSSTGGTSVFGQDVTFNVTVNPVAPGAGIPTGNVTFKIDGNTVPGIQALSGGTYSLVVSNLAVSGTAHTVVVNYPGDGNFNLSSGTLAGGQTVGKGNTSVAVTSSTLGTSVFGQTVIFTATVSAFSPAVGTPTGKVAFVIDGITVTPVGGIAISGGQATFSTSSLGVSGTAHTVTVNYLGDTNFNTGTGSLAGGQTVGKASTSVAVTSTVNPSVFGETVTFSATVSAMGPGGGMPAGSVNFIIDATTIAATLNGSGIATLATGSLPIGNHTVTVNYLGNGNYNASGVGGSTNGVLAGGQTVNQASASVAVSSSANPSVFGQSVTFTATVSAIPPAIGTPTGSVNFIIDGGAPINVALLGGIATTSTSSLAVGSGHTVVVNYLGSTEFASNSGSLALGQTVNKANTSTSIGSSLGTTVFGQTVTFTATVAAAGLGSGLPTGNVNFLLNGNSIGFGALDAFGVAKFATNAIPVAGSAYTIVSQYVGDGSFNGSSSGNGSLTVNKASTSVAVSNGGSTTTVFGETVTFTATVAVIGPGAGVPTGNVNFLVDGVSAGSGTLSGTTATFATAAIAASPTAHLITAQYVGPDSSFNSSAVSSAINQTVNKASTTNTISTTGSPAGFGVPVIQATVSVTPPGGGTPTGNVDFVVDDLIGTNDFTQTKSLVGNIATFDVTALTPSTYSITAQYQGNGNYSAAAPSSAITQVIVKADTSIAVSSSNNPSVFGQSVTFTATVSSAVGGLGTPTGNVEFIVDGTTTIAPGVALVGGVANASISSLSVGTHTVTVNYLVGDNNFNATGVGGSTAGTLSGGQVVNKANTSVAVSRTGSNPSNYGDAVTISATVTATGPGAGTPSGNVNFLFNGVSKASGILSGGIASVDISTISPLLLPGSYTVTVNYVGVDANFNTSGVGSSTGGTLAGGITVSKIASTVTVSSSTGGTSVFGQPVTFTATVAANASPNVGTPTGNVEFVVDGTTVNPGGTALSGGTATYSTSSLAVSGPVHTVTVNYLVSANYSASSNSLAGGQTVNKAATTTTVSTTNANAVYGEATISASVAVNSPGAGAVSGTVTFHIDDGINPVSDVTVGLVGSIATLTPPLNVGNYSITATYNGNTNLAASAASAAISQTVSQASSTTAVSSSTGGTSVFGQVVTFTATVAAVSPSTGTPSGNVEFVIDGATVGTGTLNGSGKTTFSTILSVGPHTVATNYLGSTNYAISSGSLVGGQTVNPAASSVTVTASPSPSVVGQAVTFTAHVNAVLPGGGLPTGTVNFLVDGATVATATGVVLVGGQATFTTSALTVGNHTVQADFISSDGNHTNNSGGLTTGVHTVLGFSKIGVALNKKSIGVNVPFAMTLSALASNGAPVPSYNGNATVTLRSAPAGGTVIGLKSAKFVKGKLVLNGLRLTRAGVYTIRVNTGGHVIDITIRTGGTWTYAQKQ